MSSVRLFTGGKHESVNNWIAHVRQLSKFYQWPSDVAVEIAHCRLSPSALNLVKESINPEAKTLDELQFTLNNIFTSPVSEETLRSRLESMRQRQKESVSSFNTRFNVACNELKRISKDALSERYFVCTYLESLTVFIYIEVLRRYPDVKSCTLREVFDYAIQLENVSTEVQKKCSNAVDRRDKNVQFNNSRSHQRNNNYGRNQSFNRNSSEQQYKWSPRFPNNMNHEFQNMQNGRGRYVRRGENSNRRGNYRGNRQGNYNNRPSRNSTFNNQERQDQDRGHYQQQSSPDQQNINTQVSQQNLNVRKNINKNGRDRSH